MLAPPSKTGDAFECSTIRKGWCLDDFEVVRESRDHVAEIAFCWIRHVDRFSFVEFGQNIFWTMVLSCHIGGTAKLNISENLISVAKAAMRSNET